MRGLVIGIVAGTIFLCVCARGQIGLAYTNWMGDELIDRPLNNALAGQVAIYCGPSFEDFGRILWWEYFDSDIAGASVSVTPIVFQRVNETDFRVRAIGAARENNGGGVRNAIFDLEMGADEIVRPGFTFGFAESRVAWPKRDAAPVLSTTRFRRLGNGPTRRMRTSESASDRFFALAACPRTTWFRSLGIPMRHGFILQE